MILPAILCSSRAAAGPPSAAKVAVVNAVDLPASLADLRSKLTADLGAAIRQRGFESVPSVDSCVDQSCVKALAAGSGASDVLVVTGGKNEFLGYRIELRLWHAGTGREERSSPECNTCSASQMIENVVRAVGPLLDHLPELHAMVAPPPVAPPSIGTSPPPLAVPATGRSPARLALGLSLIGAGVLAGASGIVLWARDGEQVDCNFGQVCSSLYDTRTPGIALTVAGVVAAGAGAAVLLMTPEKRSIAISVTPSAFSIAGTY
jgi:hypothetical protein